jgi:hypothetical protein
MSTFEMNFNAAIQKYNDLSEGTSYRDSRGIDQVIDGTPASIDAAIANLDTTLANYNAADSTNKATRETAVTTAFTPISNYYTNLTTVTTSLQKFLDQASTYVADSDDGLINEERYENRVYPERSVHAKEILFGMVPTLKTRSIPYILASGVFMSLITIFLVFQLGGVTGHINVPPAVQMYALAPFFGIYGIAMNPMVQGGVIVIVLIFGVLGIMKYSEWAKTNSKI